MSNSDEKKPAADESAYPGDDYWQAVDKKGVKGAEVDRDSVKARITDEPSETRDTTPKDKKD